MCVSVSVCVWARGAEEYEHRSWMRVAARSVDDDDDGTRCPVHR